MPAGLIARAALAAAPLVANRIFRRKDLSGRVRKLNERYLGQSPQGELSAEDTAFGERVRQSGNELIGSGVQEGRALAHRRFAARGLGGPAEEQSYSDLEQGGQVARARLGRSVGDLLLGIRERNKDFERKKLFTAWGNELRAFEGDLASESMFANSMLDYLPGLFNLGNMPTQGAGAGAGDPYGPINGSAPPGGITGPERPEEID